MNEFEIIDYFFKQTTLAEQYLILGIGDDAAILNVPADLEIVVSMDTLISGVHFFEDTSPENIAYKSLAVNLSDIAAMGALPRWVSLSLTLPENDLDWVERFSSCFNALSKEHSLTLIGGDLTKGPLSLTILIHGLSPKGKALRRSGAVAGDLIYVTGTLGAATYALKYIEVGSPFIASTEKELHRLNRPEARIKTGIALRNIATSCIDISDGLLADLGHILKASNVGAEVQLSDIPYSESLSRLDKNTAIELALTGGDDYELCFTLPASIPKATINELQAICPIHCIGAINKQIKGLCLIDEDGSVYDIKMTAFQHFI